MKRTKPYLFLKLIGHAWVPLRCSFRGSGWSWDLVDDIWRKIGDAECFQGVPIGRGVDPTKKCKVLALWISISRCTKSIYVKHLGFFWGLRHWSSLRNVMGRFLENLTSLCEFLRESSLRNVQRCKNWPFWGSWRTKNLLRGLVGPTHPLHQILWF